VEWFQSYEKEQTSAEGAEVVEANGSFWYRISHVGKVHGIVRDDS